MTAKMKSKPFRNDSRPDWDHVRVKIMRWCLRQKLAQNWEKFSRLLLSTKDLPIVEDSRKDDFWGAKATGNNTYVGMNVLGRLLMELREEIKQGKDLKSVMNPPISMFLLFGQPIASDNQQQDRIEVINPPPLEAVNNRIPYEPSHSLFEYMETVKEATVDYIADSMNITNNDARSMASELKPYSEYEKVDLPWIESLPKNWKIRRAKLLIKEKDERSTTGKEPLLRVSQYTGVTRRRSATGSESFDSRAASLVGYKKVDVDDLVINIMLAWNGSLGISRYSGVVSPAYCVYRIADEIHPWYFHHLLKSPLYKGRIKAVSTGVVDSRLRLYSDALGCLDMLLPPYNEQAAIVRFLDHANRKIDRYIRSKKKMIALLNEQKQVIIHCAVTRGLDSGVSCKPCDLYWLNQIPVHWDIKRVKSLVSAIGGMTPNKGEKRYWEGLIPWISPKDMKKREIFDSIDHISDLALRETGISLIPPPVVLIVVRGMILSKKLPTAITHVPVTINQDMKALVPNHKISPEYLSYLLTGIQQELLLLVEIAGHGTCCLRSDSWLNYKLPVPPINEQHAIEKFLKMKLSKQNDIIRHTEHEITLMQEYRTRLTADVVTGKLDVRAAAANLPDLEADDDTETGDDLVDDDSLNDPDSMDTEENDE